MRCVNMRHGYAPVEARMLCSFVGTTAALLGAAAIGGGSSILGGLFGKSAAQKAADTQAEATKYAADLQQKQYDQTRTDEMPWMQAGQWGLGQLMTGLQPGGDLIKPYDQTFKAPTAEEARATPGYQFMLDEGNRAILNGNAASGGVFSGGTLQALDKFNTGLADSTYSTRYNQALQTFDTNFNAYNVGQTNSYNRLAGLSGTGQNTATSLGQFGAQAATGIGNDVIAGANATASGIVGGSNALNTGLAGAANGASGYLTLNALMGGSGSGRSILAPSINPAIQYPTDPAFNSPYDSNTSL